MNMAVQELGNKVKKRNEKLQYKVTFIRHGHRSQIKITEIVESEDAEEALNIAFGIAEKTKWHVEQVERQL